MRYIKSVILASSLALAATSSSAENHSDPDCPTYGDAGELLVRCGPQAQSPSAQTVVVPDGAMGNLGLGTAAAVIGGALVLGLLAGTGGSGSGT